ncbi:hypothetical protein M422DRAFT_258518 [Sphaerobolus stellatus SS14]|uniref:Uncharacterized protein n=1 Tax=Sphaerobolus stellatus (strain SS14) TaxID=990650 RepID=A0A0C9VLZ5_SPHS4|nr:hypothetical protein M422DRAFT_258518 [Sphaerobolus stellatus SS14]
MLGGMDYARQSSSKTQTSWNRHTEEETKTRTNARCRRLEAERRPGYPVTRVSSPPASIPSTNPAGLPTYLVPIATASYAELIRPSPSPTVADQAYSLDAQSSSTPLLHASFITDASHLLLFRLWSYSSISLARFLPIFPSRICLFISSLLFLSIPLYYDPSLTLLFLYIADIPQLLNATSATSLTTFHQRQTQHSEP